MTFTKGALPGPGRPTKLTPDMIEPICEAIRDGCYATVAAGRVGVSGYALTVWSEKGRKESEEREGRALRGEPTDRPPPSIYEQFHIALETAKSQARYSAERRAFATMPLSWLSRGYARNDWRQSNQIVREVVDEVLRRIQQDEEKGRVGGCWRELPTRPFAQASRFVRITSCCSWPRRTP